MATTTNFGWETPDDTDLVKDGAAAIRTALGGVDTSFVDLKGGTTGQVLAKASNTDLDFVWSADASGIPATIFDAKGDIIAATAADTASRLAVGANNSVLTADSSTATGLKWATPAAPSFVGCALTKSASQSAADSTYTAITFDGEVFDTDGFHDNITNNARITIPAGKGGKYLFVGTCDNQANATGIRQAGFWKNGSIQKAQVALSAASAGETKITVSFIIDMVATDYMEFRAYQNSGAARNILDGSIFSCQFLGA